MDLMVELLTVFAAFKKIYCKIVVVSQRMHATQTVQEYANTSKDAANAVKDRLSTTVLQDSAADQDN